jgi:hypothetical protein
MHNGHVEIVKRDIIVDPVYSKSMKDRLLSSCPSINRENIKKYRSD